MSDLPHTFPGYIQVEETIFKAGVSEYLAQKLGRIANWIADKGIHVEEFLSNDTWTCPAGVEWIEALGCGGGAGGRSGVTRSGNLIPGNGGNGAPIISQLIKVTPGNVYTITIGGGGAANAAGGDTTFIGADASVYFRGAIAPDGVFFKVLADAPGVFGGVFNDGLVTFNSPFLNSTLGGRASIGTGSGGAATNGQSTQFASGGIGGANISSFNGGGGGAGFGPGGNGGADVILPTAAAANSGAGGGGGGCSGVTPFAGAAGGSGRLLVSYFGSP